MEEAVTELIIRQANQNYGNAQNDRSSVEKENMDNSNGIINVETFVNMNKHQVNMEHEQIDLQIEEQQELG
jgi:hypothetical protein